MTILFPCGIPVFFNVFNHAVINPYRMIKKTLAIEHLFCYNNDCHKPFYREVS